MRTKAKKKATPRRANRRAETWEREVRLSPAPATWVHVEVTCRFSVGLNSLSVVEDLLEHCRGYGSAEVTALDVSGGSADHDNGS